MRTLLRLLPALAIITLISPLSSLKMKLQAKTSKFAILQGFNSLMAKDKRCKAFVEGFHTINLNLAGDTEAQAALKELEEDFFTRYSQKIDALNQNRDSSASDGDITASAFASLTNTTLTTGASGATTPTNTTGRIVISGAKGNISLNGTARTAIRTMAIAEALETSAVSEVLAYGIMRPDGTYFVDCKVNDYYSQSRQSTGGYLESARVVSERFMLNKSKTAFGVSRIFLATISDGYLKLTIYTLISGAAAKTQQILSKSIVRIKTYTVDQGTPIKINDGVFLSESTCGFVGNCVSTQYGWLRVQAGIQETASGAVADSTQKVAVSGAASRVTSTKR